MTDGLQHAAQLIGRHLDEVMTDEEERQLAELMRQDSDVVDLYVRLMEIHGLLSWGVAHQTEPSAPAETTRSVVTEPPAVADATMSLARRSRPNRRSRSRTATWAVPTVLSLTILIVTGINQWPASPPQSSSQPPELSVEGLPIADDATDMVGESTANDSESLSAAALRPLQFDSLDQPVAAPSLADTDDSNPQETQTPADRLFVAGQVRDEDVIRLIDTAIADALRDHEIEPSPPAAPEEWGRRVWLTLAGRIPAIDELSVAEQPVDDVHRAELVDRLLASPARSRRLAEVWTRLLVGRAERPGIDRPALQNYLFTAFDENRSWMEVVSELISAEGRSDENGATNFLLAHLDNQATPATAVTARLFLGEQLQCVQCHHHPFAPERLQQEYWAFNAFFQNSERVPVDSVSAAGGDRPVRLTDRDNTGMTFYETLSGRQEAVVAAYDGRSVAAGQKVSRRAVLAELLATDSRSRVARAMVNRVWADFFGYGFTSPVDDMGPHVPVSHPQLLNELTSAFVASGYDLRRLQRWMALSAAWQRTSQSIAGNEQDSPESGAMPLFSRVYPRRMTPEQVYDSVRVAIRGVAGENAAAAAASDHRRQWVGQFVRPYDTDENDESDEFNGSVAQAMVMMNGDDINAAIRQAGEALLGRHPQVPPPDHVLRQMSLAVLTRPPTERESAVFRKHLNRLRRTSGYQEALPRVTEDMLWAYLNSSEFLLIH